MTELSTTLSFVALVPLLPLAVAGLLVFLPRERRGLAGALAISGQAAALLCAIIALVRLMSAPTAGSDVFREVFKFTWFEYGATALPLGLLIDPLNAAMLVMVCLVGMLVCIYSVAYMAEDGNAARFFCFISFFSAAMLGLLVANSLLLVFVCWELVGLASYLLIGFWFHKPSAAAAARKAFIVTPAPPS